MFSVSAAQCHGSCSWLWFAESRITNINFEKSVSVLQTNITIDVSPDSKLRADSRSRMAGLT